MARLTEDGVVAVLRALWNHPGRRAAIGELTRELGLPAPQVHVALEALTRRGCLIERHGPGHAEGDGVELVRTGLSCWRDILEDQARRTGENPRRLARSARVYQRTGSTNDICWTAAEDPRADGLVVLADEQEAGRGRRGNLWFSRPGQSILLSVLLRNQRQAIDSLTLLAGLACAETLEEIVAQSGGGPCDVAIKWPNDVLAGGRKIAGVLVEQRAEHVVVGVGINIAQAAGDFPAELQSRATSFYRLTGRQIDRLEVIERLLAYLEKYCLGHEPEARWLEKWKHRCRMLGQTLRVWSNGTLFEGRMTDIDPRHGMVLRDEWGTTHFLSAPTSTLQDPRS